MGKRWKLEDGGWKFYKNAEKLSVPIVNIHPPTSRFQQNHYLC
ncbi:hypothetical protein [Chryseobacterium tagetis]|nr:hypothetical protein [Chryseobacterium tagetis]